MSNKENTMETEDANQEDKKTEQMEDGKEEDKKIEQMEDGEVNNSCFVNIAAFLFMLIWCFFSKLNLVGF